ncbi:DUF4129 domain-containing protein [Streptomyces sp. H27-D2]|uniref:DUF4129 domain-containing protein n=1 Tax=Streptomyces sp. H27-D2 TaxID=3046304 RepID=UPI002DB6DDD6|nr:DUF4129 domain-containing protein [Streptomyces sp. H27-D2]MEC4019616.1 DUF4129 domain-containing protein [Streptomyces sp. H27-D2]
MTATGGTTTTAHLIVRTGDEVPVTVPRVPAHEAAERELSESKYHESDPGLFQRALDWFWKRVGDLLGSAAGATPGGWVGLLVVALVVVLLVVAVRLRLGPLSRNPDVSGALFDAGPRSAAEHRAAADRHAADHRWTEAVQERMRAIVRSLEERALLDRSPGRTADEAAAEAGRTLPEHAGQLHAAARSFDDVTYGGRPAGERIHARLRDLDTDLRRSNPSPTGAAEAPHAGSGG